MADLGGANDRLQAMLDTVEHPVKVGKDEELYCGLDVGTAFIALAVVDVQGRPVACTYQFADVVRDGMVVDYLGACDIARSLKDTIDSQLGVELTQSAVAIPPGTENLDGGVVRNVCESTGLECTAIFDEPTAANLVIGTQNGVVVDIGGGTTGVSIFEDGRVVKSVDESTGGTHFSLVLAGSKGFTFDEAETYKRDPAHHREILPVVAPTIDKVTTIIHDACAGHDVSEVILVGGTSELTGIEERVQKRLGVPVSKPNHPMFVTPTGIALGCMLKARGGLDG